MSTIRISCGSGSSPFRRLVILAIGLLAGWPAALVAQGVAEPGTPVQARMGGEPAFWSLAAQSSETLFALTDGESRFRLDILGPDDRVLARGATVVAQAGQDGVHRVKVSGGEQGAAYVLHVGRGRLVTGAARATVRLADADGRLNLRAAPTTRAAIVVTVADGAELDTLGCGDFDATRWCRVRSDSVEGWAAAAFLQGLPVLPAADAPQADAPATTDPDFAAEGVLSCTRFSGRPFEPCDYGAGPEPDGRLALRVFWPDLGSRLILFRDGVPVAFGRGAGEVGLRLTYTRSEGMLWIAIGRERYNVPEAVVAGG